LSFEASAWAIKAETGNSTQKLVLIIISDCVSGETGIGWPSVDYIAKHCMCSPASVRRALKELVSQKLLTVEEKKGRSNIYRVNEYPLQIDTPTQNDTPISNGRGGCHPILAKPHKQKAEVLNQSLTKNIYIDDELWTEFLAIRKKVKAINSPRALKTLINKIEKFHREGHDVNALVETAIVNSWKDVYLPRKENSNGNRQRNNEKTATELATNMEW